MSPDERCKYIKDWFNLAFSNTHPEYSYAIDTGRDWLHLRFDRGPRYIVSEEITKEFSNAVSQKEIETISDEIMRENPEDSEWVAGLLNSAYTTGSEKDVLKILMHNIQITRKEEAAKSLTQPLWLRWIQWPFWLAYAVAMPLFSKMGTSYFFEGSHPFNYSARFFVYGMAGCLFFAFSDSKKVTGGFFNALGRSVAVNLAVAVFVFFALWR